MNHPYPDNYHGGYTRGGPAGMQQQQGMGYGHGGYDNPASMVRMGHLRHGYNPMTQQYGEGNGGQMHPMMQQQQHPGGGMYSPHGGYMGQMGGGHYAGGMGLAGNYPGYSNMPGGGINHPGMSHSMGPGRGQHPHHPTNNMMGGSGAGSYYTNHHHSPHPPHPHHHQQAATSTTNQQPTPPPNYGHQSPSGNSSAPTSTSNPYGQQQQQQQTPTATQQNQNNISQATHHHHPSPHNTLQPKNTTNSPSANHCPSSSSSSIPPTTTQTYNMPITTQAAISNSSNNNNTVQQQQMAMSPQNSNAGLMMPNSNNQAHTPTHSQPRPPVAGPVSVMGSAGGGGGASAHSIPQHPMRHPTTQQSPQEVADNILQIASSYPTNQTVQVPLKGQNRHTPYHIPRSPHHFNTSSSSTTSTSTPSSTVSTDNFTAIADSTAVATSNHFQQHQQHPVVASPPVACSSQQSQPNTSPSTSSNVKSPNPALAPIPNPIPSPGISGIRSPSNSHCLSPCSSQQQQRSPGQMGTSSSSYSGQNQPAPSPSSIQHYSPISGGGTPQHHSTAFVHSPPSYHPSSNNQVSMSQPTVDNQSMYGNYSNMNLNAHHHHHQHQSSPYTGNNITSPNQSGQYNQHAQQCGGNNGNNPLMSLQKLVMLPETQVVDPKSVVNDACLAASANESNVNIDSKNCEGPAERFAESSDLSVGSSGQFSSLNNACHLNDMVVEAPPAPAASSEVTSCNQSDTLLPDLAANDVVDGEVKDDTPDDTEKEDNNHSVSTADVIIKQDVNEDGMKNHLQWNEVGICDNIVPNESLCSENERLDSQQNGDTSLISLMELECKEEKDADKDQLQQSLCNSSSLDNSDNKAEDQDVNISEEKMKNEETVVTNQLVNDNSKPVIDDDIDSAEKEVGQDESHKQSKLKNNEPLSPVKKEDICHCDMEQISPETESPSVLSEVQMVVNGNNATTNTEEEEEEEMVEDDKHQKVTRARLRNGLQSIVRSKIGKTAKKSTQFLRLTTPCSIAVGADEREVCEQFAFRRNGYCHALRTSRLLYNGRGRQDSTSHGDSDESIENISDTSFHNQGTPQDGNKKKNVTKRNDVQHANNDRAKSSGKMNFVGKRGKNSNGGCSDASSNVKDSDLGCYKDSNQNKELSDDDGEMCYYEGVDSTDIFTTNNSSDDSFSSSPDSKKNKQETPENSADCNTDDKDIALDQSPPAKRMRRFSAQKMNEVLKNKKSAIKENDLVASRALSNGTNVVTESHQNSYGKEDNNTAIKADENLSDRENGKVAKTRVNRRKQVFGKLLVPEEQMILPEVLVKVEKSQSVEGAKNMDTVDLTEETSNVLGITEKIKEEDVSKIDSERTDGLSDIKIIDVKTEDQESELPNKTQKSPQKGTPTKRKRPSPKKKQKANDSGAQDKDEEVRDSFKSMKFGRTLDMLKSQRKKEQNTAGPFIRIIGDRGAPKKVSLINQSAQTLISGTSGRQNQKSSSKLSTGASAGISMVSNISSNKTALVTSTKILTTPAWVCAFCNHQSSFHSLGDLFGPYYKEEDISKVEQLAIEEAKRSKENDKRSDNKKQCSPSTSKSDKVQAPLKAGKKGQTASKANKKGPSLPQPVSKKKQKLTANQKKTEEGPLEVWVHQACALWAPGVYVIGSKLYGMDEAMKDADDSICSSCKEKGAMVGCLHKGCAMKYHISCAIDQETSGGPSLLHYMSKGITGNCCLDEENLSVHCPKHKDKKLRISAASTSNLPLS